ncbi:glycosyltransferase family 4 protein [Limnoglobus roseus]|uniref:GT4 family glycosyltransferase n=1 Tax=Limnoglobus roseus TaxID=2598579 RepID=A0A5C1ARA4_9BACT|nr:glycosyltransferase family 1 protein [Limnoglobus roseus]QEL20272.1 GT4 family glycosyltransferase [Limnoglobus roseus]
MRVALFLPHLAVTGGLGVHCRSLLDAVLRTATPADHLTVIAPADPKKLFPYSGLDDTWQPLAADARVQFVPLDWPADFSLAQPLDRVLLEPMKAATPDVVYASYYTGLADPPCPQAVTFHDAGFLDFPDVFGNTAKQRRETLALIGPKIDSLMCISDDARSRICRLLPFDEARTDVVWHGLADSPAEITAARGHDHLPDALWPDGDKLTDWGPYLFSPVGAATGFNRVRKNLPTAVAAFRQLIASDAPPVRLVIASTGILHDKMLGELLPAAELAGGQVVNDAWRSADDRIRILPNLDRGPFLRAMAHSRAVVYPSRYEGFGLPTIEAMALGVPIIASRATSIPEVAGDAGYLVNPDSADEFAAAMHAMLTQPDRREELIRKGEARVALFTLDRMGEAMWKVWRRLAK